MKPFFLAILYLTGGYIISASGQEIEGIQYYHINSDQLFQSEQSAHILSVDNELLQKYELDIIYTDTLTRLSDMALKNRAIIGINGGFFNVKEGYSVSYLEKNDIPVAFTENELSKRSNPSWMLNGTIVLTKSGEIRIDYAVPDSVYLASNYERAVIGTGPMLLKNGYLSTVDSTQFAVNRHPRSCICKTEDSVLFVVVDGRQRGANGMSIYELQKFLKIFHCKDAINLDGGGSSTLWIVNDGILNNPSDITGERKIANAIILHE